MAEHLEVDRSTARQERYAALLPQLASLMEGENDALANMANCCAALRQTFGFFWVGFYLVKDSELVLGPFQGDVACTRIAFGKGVCGTAWQRKETIIVPDVDGFPGHIACSSASRSEIVVPVVKQGKVVAVLDVDSDLLDDFSDADRSGLEAVASLIAHCL